MMYSNELSAALRAVTAAARVTQAVRRGTEPATLQKGDRSPVTVADFGSQAVVCRVLKEAFPADPIIAEEDASTLRSPGHESVLERIAHFVRGVYPDANAGQVADWIDRGNAHEHSPRYWTLDPIDGTKGFLRGDQYAIALALVIDGVPTVAALACPALPSADVAHVGVVLWAVRDAGCFQFAIGQAPDEAVRVRVSSTREPNLARMSESVESGHSSHDNAATVALDLGITIPPRRMDSQAKYAVVARGETDFYMRLPVRKRYTEKIWDHAAGSLVVEESGGIVTDVHGRRLDFSHGPTLRDNTGVVASNGHLHERVLAALAKAGIKAV